MIRVKKCLANDEIRDNLKQKNIFNKKNYLQSANK